MTGFPFLIDQPGSSDGTDAFGFGALPAGNDNEFYDIGIDGAYFWSSSEYDDDWDFTSYYISLHNYDDKAYLNASYKDLGFSVRCVKD